MHITAGENGGGIARNRHFHLPVNDVERFVPRVKVRRWPAALHAFLDMHFKGFAQIAAGQDSDRFANDIDRCRRGLQDVNRAHDDSPQVRLHLPIVGA
ncbi:hypothetical protein D3C84_763300 [compost metagenome]